MKYNIGQKNKRQGNEDWWQWDMCIDEDDDTLDKIEYVEYFLHETFPNPIRKITTRENKFLLKSSGWGEFTVHIRVHHKDPSIPDCHQDEDLILDY